MGAGRLIHAEASGKLENHRAAIPVVVVIDDRRANLVATEALLQPLGYRVLLADNAEDGLAYALSEEVALVIADVRMPGVDGLEMLTRLRQRGEARKTPVVFLSGYSYDSDQARRAYALGAVDYIVKPIDPDILRAKIAALVTLFEQEREIERRGRAIRVSERETAEAKDTVREKDRHIGVLGHDLRNPLFGIVAGLNVLARSNNLSEAERATVARMLRSGDRMATMIRDLLDYTRTSLGAFPHNPVPMDLMTVCEAAIDELRSIHPDRTITCEFTGNAEGNWDPVRLQQVVSNLVGNALEHSESMVSVRVEAGTHDVVLSVRNDGEPIPPDVLPILFEPFRRGDRSPNGLGLGLFIVREIIRRHGGTINVRSSPDAGTTFVSRWPRHAPSRATSTAPTPAGRETARTARRPRQSPA
jgi:signal transduction histidine kinase